MLRPKVQLNLMNAREYFREHLCVGDYYSQGQKITGEWLGIAAKELGLTGTVSEKDFLALCEGKNPRTGHRLTQRLNTVRHENGMSVSNRRIFHDFTISPPKSVSVVALCHDQWIVGLHDQAVRLAMTELETFAQARVRRHNRNDSCDSGNMVAACFRHETSRELDPHLHTHCVVFNATFDPYEGRWKALQTEGMYRAQKLAENLYFHELAKGLRSFGYEIENNSRNFEIKHVPKSVIALFSKRHVQIEAEAQCQAAQGYRGNMGELRNRIAHEERRRKIKNSTADELRSHWKKQMSVEERQSLENLHQPAQRQTLRAWLRQATTDVAPDETVNVRAIVDWADQHMFERRSVVNDYELKAAALARGRGQDFDLADLNLFITGRNYVRNDYEPHKLVSRELFRFEQEIVAAAKEGQKRFDDFNRRYKPDPGLSEEQARAAQQIIKSHDFITLFRGGAGTGKSHTLREVEQAIAETGAPVFVLAPQRQQVQDLENDGLRAQTLAHALKARQFPRQSVVILDEAGQVGVRDMRELVQLVQSLHGRLILSGDTRQHGAVAAGDALRAIETHADLRPAVLRTIRRQNPSLAQSAEERRFIRGYRAAVKEAAAGKIVESYDRLEKLGCVHELSDEPRRAAIAGEYLTAMERGGRPLVVAQTWGEVHAANDAIRLALRSAGRLEEGETLRAYQPIDRSEAQKCDARFYEPGHSAFFLKGYGRYAKGELYEVAGADDRGVILVKDGRQSTVSYRYAERFSVVKAAELKIAPGDRLQLKANGRSVEGVRLHNGELVTVARVEPTGALVVNDDRGLTKTLAPSQRLFVHGYAVTSYASQGKTVDSVILADSGQRAATHAQQWYVSISRGRKHVVVLTPDKAALRMNIQRSGEREPALPEEPMRNVDEGKHVQGLRQRAHLYAESIRQHEFIRQRMNINQQQTRGIRI
ncbi:MAG TPA: MobF family relaxase [Opitutaceae bacterium]|jgi:conjugative relaxase-like TrwC/TraI family protein|nr:MobF family relaxase [Opitutaceae bacterium]